MPKNFAFFQKPLDKFFYKFDNPEINCQEIFPASFKNIENKGTFETAISILHSFFVFLVQLQVFGNIVLNIFMIQTLCTVMQLFKVVRLDFFGGIPPKFEH